MQKIIKEVSDSLKDVKDRSVEESAMMDRRLSPSFQG